MPTVIHLKAETKKFERRTSLSPQSAKALVDAGYIVRVERSPDRIYNDDEYSAVGAELIPLGTWVDAPRDHIILGLKELEDDGTDLHHEFILFQHCFKKQTGYKAALSRFQRGGGKLYDLEFLVDSNGRRVSAFGSSAGYAGTALALISWAHQIVNPGKPQGAVPLFDSASALVEYVVAVLKPAIAANGGNYPRVIILGALGRCGSGAIKACESIGIPSESVIKYDLEETKAGGPFPEIAESDVFSNCVYLGPHKIPPFVTFESLSTPKRKLRVIADISCDPNSENNPIPIYSTYSSFDDPTTPTSKPLDPELRIVAIDHLPTMIARESSDEFSSLLLPSLLALDRRDTEGVWTRAEKVFNDRVAEAAAEN